LITLYNIEISFKIFHIFKKIDGIGNYPFIMHPAQCKRETAGYIGPFVSPASVYATPIHYPLSENANVPLFIFR